MSYKELLQIICKLLQDNNITDVKSEKALKLLNKNNFALEEIKENQIYKVYAFDEDNCGDYIGGISINTDKIWKYTDRAKMNEIIFYLKNKPMASLCLTNCLTLNIYEIIREAENYVIVGYSNDKKHRKLKLYFDNKGNRYFTLSGKRFYLDEFLRTNI